MVTKPRLTDKQAEVLAALQANQGRNSYFRECGILQPNAMVVAGRDTLTRAAPTVDALERKGFVKIDRRAFSDPTWPIYVTVEGREALEARS